MRFSRGVVKIPVKYVYVFLIVTSTAFCLYLHILKHQRSATQGPCRVIPEGHNRRRSKSVIPRSQQNHGVCQIEPDVTKFEECAHCFRPNVQALSRQLYQVQYSTSLLPRGPPNLFKPRNTVQQDLIVDYLITPSHVCLDTCPYLAAVILSVSDDVDQRNAVRATWASAVKTRLWPYAQLNADIQVVFVLAHQTDETKIIHGKPQTPKKVATHEHFPTVREWSRIKSEAERYGDILYLNMQDSYYNLTLKLMSAFKWVAEHCAKTKFFLKVDIDTFVSVPLMLDLLIVTEDRLEYSVLGRMYLKEKIVRRTNEWAVDSNVYPPATFPVYASDCAYVISSRLLSRMIEVTPYMDLAAITRYFHGNQSKQAELFVTGILGLVLGYDYFTEKAGIMTSIEDRDWFWCDIINNKKVFGKIFEENGLYKLWRSFFRFYGKCWKEIPELANPHKN